MDYLSVLTYLLELSEPVRSYSAVIKIHDDQTYIYQDYNHGRRGEDCTGTYSFKRGGFYSKLDCSSRNFADHRQQDISFSQLTKLDLTNGTYVKVYFKIARYAPMRKISFKIRRQINFNSKHLANNLPLIYFN